MAHRYERPPGGGQERALSLGATKHTVGAQSGVSRWEWMVFPVGLFLCSRAALFAFSWLALTPNMNSL